MEGTGRGRVRKVVILWLLAVSPVLAGAAAPGQAGGKRLQVPYEGFPPLIPHDVQALKGGQCLTCHGTGMGGAPLAPHPSRTHFCLQCHVPQDPAAKPFVRGGGK